MASTLAVSNLTVTISEQLTSNGQTFNYTNQLILANIKPFDPRVMTIPTSLVTVILFGAAVAAGTFIGANVRYVRITNKDDTNFVILMIGVAGGQVFFVKLDPGKSHIVGNNSVSSNITGANFSSFANTTFIGAQSDTAPVDIEYFVASI